MDPLFASARAALPTLRGEAGAYVCDASGRELYAERADEAFPAASVIKLPLVMTLYADASRGLVNLEERIAAGARVDGSGVLRHLRDAEPLTLRDLATLTIIVSDNTATNRLIERLGADRVNERMREWGCTRSRLARKMYDFAAAASGQENVMTARETASLLRRVLAGECEGRAASDAVLATLRECQDATMLRRYLPPGTKVAHKSGTLEATRNDAGILEGPRPVVVAAFTRKLSDPRRALAWLGRLGWCAYAAAGNPTEPLPPELAAGA